MPKTKRKNLDHLEMIEPWLGQHDNNPFLNLRSKQLKVKKDSPKIKRQSSLNLAKNWKSIQKVVNNRESKILPVMDVGKLNSIRRGYNSVKSKPRIDYYSIDRNDSKKSVHNQQMLPLVRRELAIERKIFLLKNIHQKDSNTSSPTKSERIRRVISGSGVDQ